MSNPYEGDSTAVATPGLKGTNTALTSNGIGVMGVSTAGEGVHGETNSTDAAAIAGISNSTGNTVAAVWGWQHGSGSGVFGHSETGEGVHGETNSPTFAAVSGIMLKTSGTGAGVFGLNDGKGDGVTGISPSETGAGIHGIGGQVSTLSQPGPIGVWGESLGSIGVYGVTGAQLGVGVLGQNNLGPAIHGIGGQGGNVPPDSSTEGTGVWGESSNGIGIYGASTNGMAGFFQGNVKVTGTLQAVVDVVLGSDCAEDFDVVCPKDVEAGTVMVLTEKGALQTSCNAYDKKVAGVISGAGAYQPGLILGRSGAQGDRLPLALAGKVFCKVDASERPIEIGDLLTTSSTPGRAMKAVDIHRAFGCVIGKALAPLELGFGLIPILVALQ